MLPQATLNEAESVLAACRAKGIMLATAESCTGGLIAAALTAIDAKRAAAQAKAKANDAERVAHNAKVTADAAKEIADALV